MLRVKTYYILRRILARVNRSKHVVFFLLCLVIGTFVAVRLLPVPNPKPSPTIGCIKTERLDLIYDLGQEGYMCPVPCQTGFDRVQWLESQGVVVIDAFTSLDNSGMCWILAIT